MAHVVTEKCNGCKFTDCVEVCPVACFYEMDTQVVIHADDCIDCMACVEVCPVHAIYADADVPAESRKTSSSTSVEANQIKDSGAAAITVRKDALPTANDRKKRWVIRSRREARIEERDLRDRRQNYDGNASESGSRASLNPGKISLD